METEPRGDIVNRSKYILYISILFVAVLMIANTVAVKIVQIGPFSIAGGILVFPVSYIFGDILTEVYGYKASRKIIWSGLAALVLMSLVYWLVQVMPAAPFWQNQNAYDLILGAVPRIVLGSIIGYFAGEFSNSYVLSRMKIWTNGKHLWMRTIGSTVVGEGVDTVLFTFIAFYGVFPLAALLTVLVSGYLLKVAYEIVVTPITYLIVNWLKRAEGMDIYDRGIDYNPFTLAE
ncbi:transporter [Candidatus Kaiserbacteria bacterium RIFCSPLOWO2_12_FULL_52_8]|uniref:Probable queuosine precursor transporter n=1 Tax=Candidatus Kaiserbacteria bacterium RIFCSPHIGHO2_01_FULL_53_31 TaxID=1798481 RepID=A0A1F6CI06_9BACT|nr:MAG: transporter [Candidatus Kaiserbacteria bacterium RIFCSPHIGHO2_01_FULL_53_31]OGG93460.1 MAG: transporter [Candidatus Kaiserbacteria bacterium RIFCSPLOWO2_12_FULL_52_8]